MNQIQILKILVFGFILPTLKSNYILVQLPDEIIGHRNQDNGFPDRFVEVESRDGGNDEVTTGRCNPNFVDKDGDNCQAYADKNYCTINGDYGKKWNMSEKFADYAVNGEDASACPQCGCIEIPCIPKDSDGCLQNVEDWENYVCNHLKDPDYNEYCDTYPKTTRRCCPEACENPEDFTESVCEASEGSGTCKYPNEAQCSEIYTNLYISRLFDI